MSHAIKTICTGLFLLCTFAGLGQAITKIDRLKTAMATATQPAQRLVALQAFCDEWESYSPDTLKKYADAATQLAASQNGLREKISADYHQAVWLFQVNKLDTALRLVENVITRYEKNFPFDEMYVKLYALKGNILNRTARMEALTANYYNLIRMGEQYKDTLAISRGTLGIGNVNLKLKKYSEALKWYHQALALMQNPVYRRKMSFIYNNIGITFYHLQKEDSSVYYIQQGINYSRQDQNLTNLANAVFLHAGILAEFNHPQEAEQSFKQAVEIRKQIGDIYYLITDMGQLALFYANTGQTAKGIALCKEGLALSAKHGRSYGNMNSLYEVLGRNYLAAADYKSYSDVLVKQLALKDSIYSRESAQAIAEVQAKYDVQKKETIIIQQKLDLLSKNYQLYGSLGLLLIAITSSIIIFQQYRRKQSLKLRLMQQEEKSKADKAVTMAEETERKRIAADLHDSLGAYAASIASNIDHLQRHASAENKNLLQELSGNAQAIVSQLSDTIWVLKKDAQSLTAISDRIKLFMQKIAPSYPQITIDVHEEIETDHLLPPAQAFHLFQIIKEASNNALRHSRCRRLLIKVEAKDGWRLTISDDGGGLMQSATLAEGGSGLLNMRTRAEESGWRIAWQAAQPTGTTVIIEPTIN